MKNERELQKLKKGDYFGELALLTNGPRAATVIAESELECFRLSANDFQTLFGEYNVLRILLFVMKKLTLVIHIFVPQAKYTLPNLTRIPDTLEHPEVFTLPSYRNFARM